MKKKVIIFFVILIIAILAKNSYSNDDISYKTEYVVAGDTLWSIAEQEVNNNEYYKNDDVRDRKSTRLNSSHKRSSRMPSSA